jgi:hypothetical protein
MPDKASRWAWPRHGEVIEPEGQQAILRRLEWLAWLLDARFGIPGTSWRIGWDSLVGLIPGVGDVVSMAPALYIVWQGYRLGVPRLTLLRMLGWVTLDTVVGSTPIAGDVLDVFLKTNLINMGILRRHVRQLHEQRATLEHTTPHIRRKPRLERYTD